MASDSKSLYGIIGNPLTHSLSPLIHNAAFEELGLDAEYKLFPLEGNELEDFFKKLREPTSPVFGLNVTVPYKEKVIPFLDNMSPYAKITMAVNTIVISKDRKLDGHNTDGPGFLSHLAELGFSLDNKRIAILGAGGTARAMVTALLAGTNLPESICIFNRNRKRADDLWEDLKQRMDVQLLKVVDTIDDLNVEAADLLINTTPVGLNPDDESLINAEFFHSHLLVYDAIYNPPETKLLKAAREKGAKTANGLGMLFFQAMLAFHHWAECEIPDDIKARIRERLQQGT